MKPLKKAIKWTKTLIKKFVSKLSNTHKHANYAVLLAVAFALIHKLINLIPNTQFEFGWFAVYAMIVYALRWEIVQKNNSSNPNYWRDKWVDSVVDYVVSVGCFMLTLWICGTI
ncbi:MAG: hypothetical protein Q8M92_00440 [Candidatus Subteraquimicrobiales bacterium]|nr:hypothetical protein [Candidatus Subteraquimicrobiales bacterium]